MAFGDRKIVEIQWRDSINIQAGGWMDRAEVDEYLDDEKQICQSVGYHIDENDHVLVIAHTEGSALGTLAGVYTIPKAAIVSRRDY